MDIFVLPLPVWRHLRYSKHRHTLTRQSLVITDYIVIIFTDLVIAKLFTVSGNDYLYNFACITISIFTLKKLLKPWWCDICWACTNKHVFNYHYVARSHAEQYAIHRVLIQVCCCQQTVSLICEKITVKSDKGSLLEKFEETDYLKITKLAFLWSFSRSPCICMLAKLSNWKLAENTLDQDRPGLSG